MIRWLEAWLTPCPRWLRELGYLDEMLNVRACRDQCYFAWEPHLRHTRALLCRAAQGCPHKRKALILGAGMLHDVPLAELATAFREVILVDILPTRATRRLQRRWANVRVHVADVTGTLETVHRGASLPRVQPDLFLTDDDIDLVASVNLLSQLPYLPVKYLRQLGRHAEADIEAYARGVVQEHLDYLARFRGTCVLVADFQKQTIDRAGRVVESESTIHHVELPWPGEEWDWQLAPVMYLQRERGYRLRVRGAIRPS